VRKAGFTRKCGEPLDAVSFYDAVNNAFEELIKPLEKLLLSVEFHGGYLKVLIARIINDRALQELEFVNHLVQRKTILETSATQSFIAPVQQTIILVVQPLT
jgi:hypothetical protein